TDGGQNVKNDKPAGTVNLVHLRSQIVKHPGVHGDMDQSAVEEPGGHEAPPLPGEDSAAKLAAELVERLDVQVHEGAAVAESHAVDDGDKVQPEIDDEQHRGRVPDMRDQAAEEVGWGPNIDRPRADCFMAV